MRACSPRLVTIWKPSRGRKDLFRNLDLYDPGKRRRFGGDLPNERFDFLRRPRHLNFDAIRLVPDPAVEPVLMGQLEDERSKTNALDNASDAYEDTARSRVRIRLQADTLLRSQSGAHRYSRSVD